MKNIGKVSMIAMSSCFLGCVSNASMSGDVDPELVCRDRQVTVNHAPAFLIAYPEYIEVCAGQRITVNIVPAVREGSARTMPGKGNPAEASWLSSENREGDEIVIEIPENTLYATYKYSITLNGVGTLDPRVRITRR